MSSYLSERKSVLRGGMEFRLTPSRSFTLSTISVKATSVPGRGSPPSTCCQDRSGSDEFSRFLSRLEAGKPAYRRLRQRKKVPDPSIPTVVCGFLATTPTTWRARRVYPHSFSIFSSSRAKQEAGTHLFSSFAGRVPPHQMASRE